MQIASGQHILIPGAGLVGSLAGIYLARKGFKVTLLDKRSKPGTLGYDQSRSINLAVSHRAWKALELIGVDAEIRKIALPMSGRIVHDLEGKTQFFPYGNNGEAIYSVSRGRLNEVLNDHAAAEPNVEVHYGTKARSANLLSQSLLCDTPNGPVSYDADVVLACDGAFSAVRQVFQVSDRFDFSQEYIAHGYQEFHMGPAANGDWAMDSTGLHIWPRKNYMLIALPNPDKTFTCTLFLAWEGVDDSFAALKDADSAQTWFQENYPDFCTLVPDFAQQARKNVISSLVTIRCAPWNKKRTLLLGDAAHAIVPFFGQGMNAGFEDVSVLMEMLPNAVNWENLLTDFAQKRKPDADAIADLALANFVEMRDTVTDPSFQLEKKITNRLSILMPEQWTPLYTLVSFTSTPYSVAAAQGKMQKRVARQIMALPDAHDNYLDDSWLLDAYQQLTIGVAV